MKRFHVHVSVTDLARSIRFYSTIFGATPTVEKGDYAKWMLEDPRINFAISARGDKPGVNHLGLQVDAPEELALLRQQVGKADIAADDEPASECCYALSDKYWIEDPQGVAWETFHTLGDIPLFGKDHVSATPAGFRVLRARFCGCRCAPVLRASRRAVTTGARARAERSYNLLFLCTGNSARSILAEAIVNHVANQDGRFHGYSAGSFPKAHPNPHALELLRRHHIPTDGLTSKPWDVFAELGAPALDFVFTVCDEAAGEVCPIWPGEPMTAHWGIPDPAAVEGSDEDKQHAFFDAYVALKRRIELFTNLPIASLDRMTLLQRMREIGTQ